MYRYRYEGSRSHEVETGLRLGKIDKVGKIRLIRGYRYIGTRSYVSNGERHTYTTDFERVMVLGSQGTARFSGCCWGYGGSGPHALRALLMKCGISKEMAEDVAFRAPRNANNHAPGLQVDWEIDLTDGTNPVVKTFDRSKGAA
jgi:hypothetical protein